MKHKFCPESGSANTTQHTLLEGSCPSTARAKSRPLCASCSPSPTSISLKGPKVDNYWVSVRSLKGPYLTSNHLLTVDF